MIKSLNSCLTRNLVLEIRKAWWSDAKEESKGRLKLNLGCNFQKFIK